MSLPTKGNLNPITVAYENPPVLSSVLCLCICTDGELEGNIWEVSGEGPDDDDPRVSVMLVQSMLGVLPRVDSVSCEYLLCHTSVGYIVNFLQPYYQMLCVCVCD